MTERRLKKYKKCRDQAYRYFGIRLYHVYSLPQALFWDSVALTVTHGVVETENARSLRGEVEKNETVEY